MICPGCTGWAPDDNPGVGRLTESAPRLPVFSAVAPKGAPPVLIGVLINPKTVTRKGELVTRGDFAAVPGWHVQLSPEHRRVLRFAMSEAYLWGRLTSYMRLGLWPEAAKEAA